MSVVEDAIQNVNLGIAAYCKFLSANDSGETGGHQSGILISVSAGGMMFTQKEMVENHILKKNIAIQWYTGSKTDSVFTWYESKKELRLTKFGRGFDLLRPEFTGALFVLVKHTEYEYSAFLLNTEDEIQTFLDTYGLSPAETNRLIDDGKINPELKEKAAFDAFINEQTEDFPSSEEMSSAARKIREYIYHDEILIRKDPDSIILSWTDLEYSLFKYLEEYRYGASIRNGFLSVEDFVALANTVLNRRKSRAGKSFEHHLSAIFDGNNIRYTAQKVTEGNKKPDFLFPSIDDYRNKLFSVEKLCTLAAKTTCKDRWRQIISEADRLRNRNKFLCTMQQGITAAQIDEMTLEKVILVVPEPFIATYPKSRRHLIWTISQFVGYVREMEDIR